MRKSTLLLLGMVFACAAHSQSSFSQNFAYIEAGGNGLFGSINYERQFSKKPGFGMRAGLGFYAEYGFYLTVPVAFNYLIPLKNENQFLEGALGLTPTLFKSRPEKNHVNIDLDHFLIPTFGFRKHTRNNYMWRINVGPVVGIQDGAVLPWVGFSYGKRF
jgi:hypothetical protein